MSLPLRYSLDGAAAIAPWTRAGKKLHMGKSCVRFKKLEDVPLKVVGQAVKRVPVKKLIAFYETIKASGGIRAATSAKKSTRKKK